MKQANKQHLLAVTLLLVIGVISCLNVLTENSQLTEQPNSLRIGSFNIQIFGLKKLSNQDVLNNLLRIVSRYDVCLVQEVRDQTESAIFSFVDMLNANNALRNYKVSVSARLGRTNSKEQYAFVYDSKRVNLVASYQFNDTQNWFERPPYSVLIKPTQIPTTQRSSIMWLTGVHIKPSDAVAEIAHMTDVFDSYAEDSRVPQSHKIALQEKWIMMGDLNAGCSYVPKRELDRLRTLAPRPSAMNGFTDPQPFVWLVSDTTDTTTGGGVCPYDRFVCSPSFTRSTDGMHIVGTSVAAFEFDKAYNLSPELAKKVSDHYPIELTVRY